MITTCPCVVKSHAVLNTVNPVTQLALVAVNKASVNEIGCVVIRGNDNRMVPITIKIKKEDISKTGGLRFNLPNKVLALENSINIIMKKYS